MKTAKSCGVNCTGDETSLIQCAINSCAENGEALVFEEGIYTVTSLSIPSNSRIILEKGAVILANGNFRAWEKCDKKPLILSIGSENIVIEGEGEICCNGGLYHDEVGKPLWKARPLGTIVFRECRNITLRGIRVTNSVSWTVHFDNCEHILADGIIIRNPGYNEAHCCDGIDINGCRFAEIRNCDIETGDDAICLKNTERENPGAKRAPMYDIHIHDCTLATTCNGFKIGTETVGDIFGIKVENIVLKRHSCSADSGYPEGAGIPLSAVNIQSNDGASVHGISVKNFHARIAGTPIFMVLQKRETLTESPAPGKLYDITVENLTVDSSIRPSLINCCEDAMVENVILRNIRIHNNGTYKGIYKAIRAEGRCYPDPYNYGHFPAYGLFAYNVKNLVIQDADFTKEDGNDNECIVIK